jgi:hypothetical protein
MTYKVSATRARASSFVWPNTIGGIIPVTLLVVALLASRAAVRRLRYDTPAAAWATSASAQHRYRVYAHGPLPHLHDPNGAGRTRGEPQGDEDPPGGWCREADPAQQTVGEEDIRRALTRASQHGQHDRLE